MNKQLKEPELVIRGLLKLNERDGERRNVVLFIESCYGGRVRNYDFDAALASIRKLTDREQRALIAWIM